MKHNQRIGDGQDVYLYPGEVFISNNDRRVITLLGTCVSIILYSHEHKLGGIIHGLLPSINHTKKKVKSHELTNYIDYAFYLVLEKFLSLGISKSKIKAKLFGGASVIKSLKNANIGSKNIEHSVFLLNKENIKIIAKDTGGSKARKIIFYPKSGEVYMKYLKNTDVFLRTY